MSYQLRISVYKTTSVLLLILSTILLTSCSDELTRSKAEQIIIKDQGYPRNRTYKFFVDSPFETSVYHKLQDKGILTYTLYGNSMNRGVSIDFTEEGKQYVLSEPYIDRTAKVVDVVSGVESFIEITGVKPINENEMLVEYTVVFDSVSPFGEVKRIVPETFTVDATFNKYDDGWRISKIVEKKKRY